MTETDITRIEKKLDLLIDFFNIGKSPKQSPRQIDDWAKKVVLDLQKKKRKPKK